MFLGKTQNPHRASLVFTPRISINGLRHCVGGNLKKNAGGNPAMDYHPIQGRVAILLVASSYENWDKPAEGFAPTGSLKLFLNCLNIKKKKQKKKKTRPILRQSCLIPIGSLIC